MGMIEAPTVHGLRGKELFLSLDLHNTNTTLRMQSCPTLLALLCCF
jgi:hypothetical protein